MYNLVWQSVMCRPGKRSRTTIRPQDFGTRAPPRELPSFLSVTSTSGRDRTLRVLVTTAKAAAPRVSVTWQHPTRAPVCDWMTYTHVTPTRGAAAQPSGRKIWGRARLRASYQAFL